MPSVDLTSLPQLTNDCFYPLYSCHSRYLILWGGAGSGKSVYAAQKIVVRTLAEKGHRFLVVRKVAKTIRQSCFAEIQNIISSWGLSSFFRANATDMEIRCLNGNQILFAGLDDVEKLKSIHGVTGIWGEEPSEFDEGDLKQLDLRLRGQTKHYKQILLTFNPVSITHFLKGYVERKNDTTAHHSTYHDNRFIDAPYIKLIESFKGVDDYYYSVYGLGEWGVVGKTIFPAAIVTQRIAGLRNQLPPRRGLFIYGYESEQIVPESIQWIDDETGYIRIYAEPKQYYPYVLGGDTAGDGSDWFAGQALDNTDGSQAAVLHHQFDEDLFARQVYCLGSHYNRALAGIETNFSTFPVKELERLKYHRQYVRESAPDSFTGKPSEKHGFMTTKLTRPAALANLVKVVRESPGLFNDIPTLEEMLTFVRNEKGRAEAQNDKHDDLIMSLAIAHYIRDQQRDTPDIPKPQLKGTYAYGELLLMGYSDSQIRKLRDKVKIIGDRSRKRR
jgi:phage terminase large subunit